MVEMKVVSQLSNCWNKGSAQKLNLWRDELLDPV